MSEIGKQPKTPADRLILTEDFDWQQLGQRRKLDAVFDEVHAVKLGASFIRFPGHGKLAKILHFRGVTTILDIGYDSLKEKQIEYNLKRDANSRYDSVTVATNMGSRLLQRHVEISNEIHNGPGVIALLGRREHRDGYDEEIENVAEAQASLRENGLGLTALICDSDQLDRTEVLDGSVLRIAQAVRVKGDSSNEHVTSFTPDEVLKRGADKLAVGEPITTSDQPLLAALEYIDAIRASQFS